MRRSEVYGNHSDPVADHEKITGMHLVNYPERQEWAALLERPESARGALEKNVKKILDKVRLKGDKAVRAYTRTFDGVRVRSLEVTAREHKAAIREVDDALREAIQLAYHNIRKFHELQPTQGEVLETMPGVTCWRKSVPIDRVGLYIPGGTAPLFSTILMLGVPAAIAGCEEVILCSPPREDGTLHPAILYTASLVGITRIFKCGGVQAIGAMAYGTATIPPVSKIFGPGNQYVTCAKQLIQKDGISIDLPAGPSEVAVFADASANPRFIAADLLSQAEHGIDSQVILVTTAPEIAAATQQEIQLQLKDLPRSDIARQALTHSKIILVNDADEGLALLNAYAPEHLILSCKEASFMADKVINAGSVFIGHYAPESVGDYASGTNHTLPTNGFAKAYSGVSVDSFQKKITFQELTPEGLRQVGPAVIVMAEAEGLQAHAQAVRVRMELL